MEVFNDIDWVLQDEDFNDNFFLDNEVDPLYQVGYFTHSGFKVKGTFQKLDDANLRCSWLQRFRPLKRHFYTVRFI